MTAPIAMNAPDREPGSLSYAYTPLWTAPEVVQGNYGIAVDVWSLGCVCIEMASAELPWSECGFDNPFQALFHIGRGGKPQVPARLSPGAREFIDLCLDRDPRQRPTAPELLQHSFIVGS